jgi:hypothetical protein
MEDFKKSSKMQCFREGGSVKYKSRHSEKSEMSEDISQDKKVVKKAFAMHDKQEHPGEKTDLSKLKNGGRAKKDCGTVRKYKTGGTVENTYGTPMTKKDIKNVDKAKMQKPKMLCGGKSVKKMQAGGMIGMLGQEDAADMKRGQLGKAESTPRLAPGSVTELEKRRMIEKMERAKKYLSPSQQSELIKQSPAAAGLTGGGYKKGGCVTNMKDGGSLKETDAEENPGLAKLPTNVRNKMGYMRSGGKAKKMNTGGTCS